MKKTIYPLFIFIGVLLLSACKKCSDCEYHIMGIKQEGVVDEFCDDELEEANSNYNASSGTGWKCK